VLAGLVVTGASAASRPRMSAADRAAIGVLIDRFVKDAVRRENLAAAWALAGPDLRGGTTYKAWVAGTGVTVPTFPVRGSDFRHAWTGHLVAPGHAELSMIMIPRPGSRGFEETAAAIDVRKIRGKWLVDLFYAAAVYHKQGISGPNDFKAGPGGSAYGNSQSRIGGHWLVIGLIAAAAIVLSIPLAVWIRVRRRDRRALAAYSDGKARRNVLG
jgi:hypothetical protein